MEKYKPTPAEIEDLEREGLKQGELLTEEQKAYTLQRLETAYFKALVEGFEATDNPSTDPLGRARIELEKVENLIGGKFQRCTTGSVYSNLSDVDYSKLPGGTPPSIWLFYRNDGRPGENIAFWHERICVGGIDGKRYVRKHHAIMSANDLNSHHPDDLHFVVSALAFQRFKEYLQKLLEGNAPTPKKRKKEKSKGEKVLPSFQIAYNDDPLDLWRKLSKMPKPLVSKSGKFTWEGENVSVLMALAQAMVTAEQINGGHKQESVYRMLCRHFEIPETKRPRIKAATVSGFTEVYSEYLTAFNDLFSE